MRAPEFFETVRLVLQRPRPTDIEAIFTRYASDPDVTRFVAWSRHKSLGDTEAFIEFSDAEWDRCPAGPYILRSRADGGTAWEYGPCFRDIVPSLDRLRPCEGCMEKGLCDGSASGNCRNCSNGWHPAALRHLSHRASGVLAGSGKGWVPAGRNSAPTHRVSQPEPWRVG
jgi:hypothetical protein